MLPSLLDFLKYISDECSFVLKNTNNITKEDFLTNDVLTRAVVRSLEIIGEATKKISTEVKTKYPQIA